MNTVFTCVVYYEAHMYQKDMAHILKFRLMCLKLDLLPIQ